jgi:hypothetical protein
MVANKRMGAGLGLPEGGVWHLIPKPSMRAQDVLAMGKWDRFGLFELAQTGHSDKREGRRRD